jgi:uncharacterized LabA/DUF88 family protein
MGTARQSRHKGLEHHIMAAQFARSHTMRGAGSLTNLPHAALLIDFDNVTMGIRSDLTKELKNLLNSDIIKGKVAVQRAYADWRRYPQYIVPLAESSVDLIFAPAYGSAKKNATDIRLAIDALELVFTRSEIGTFILLSGDSDFSSLVLKLKEYGKYVIGVGIRESASDLLVQNCDEYYSYSALTGLTRAGDEVGLASADPWELAERAVRQMVDNQDVMRSDRLKQVILELDPNFDEKALGFTKFNRFVQEAAGRGLLSLRKMENGQYEIGLPAEGAQAADAGEAAELEAGRRRGRRGRRGRDDRGTREPRAPRESVAAAETTPAPTDVAAAAPAETAAVPPPPAAVPPAAVPPPPAAVPPAAAEAAAPAARERRPERDRGAERAPAAVRGEEPRAAQSAPRRGAAAPGATVELRDAYDLLLRATGDLAGGRGDAVRDSDVKRRMLELSSDWDEGALGFSKFSRFLRQAHDAEVIDLRQLDNGNYEVKLPEGVAPISSARHAGREERGRGRGRGRDRDRRDREPAAAGARSVDAPAAAAAGPAPRGGSAEASSPAIAARAEEGPGGTQATTPATPKPSPGGVPVPPSPASAPSRRDAAAAGAVRPLGFRRGSRGGPAAGAPPPLLEGQTIGAPAAASAAAATASPPQPATAAAPDRAAVRPAAAPADARALGLPTRKQEVIRYLASYKGVGDRSAEAVVDAFGADNVFAVLMAEPQRARDAVGGRRGERLVEAWQEDLANRQAEAGAASRAGADGSRERAGERARGGRGRGRSRATRPQPAEASPAPEAEAGAAKGRAPAQQARVPAKQAGGATKQARGATKQARGATKQARGATKQARGAAKGGPAEQAGAAPKSAERATTQAGARKRGARKHGRKRGTPTAGE